MDSILLKPGILISEPPKTDPSQPIQTPSDLQILLAASAEFDLAAKSVAEKITYDQTLNDSKNVSLKSMKGLDVMQKIEKSDQDSFIGANALSMVHGNDDNETDMLSLKYVVANSEDYLVCAKSDGVRYLMFVCSNGKVFLNDRKCQFFEVKAQIPPFFINPASLSKPEDTKVLYIFDGELILNSSDKEKLKKAEASKKPRPLSVRLQYLIFDTLMDNRCNLIARKYSVRLEQAKLFTQKARYYLEFFPESSKTLKERADLKDSLFIDIYLKDFYACKQVEFLLRSVVREGGPLPHENDGLIFTKINYPYFPGKNRGILKWKPSNLNTIDFFVTMNEFYADQYPDLFSDGNFNVLELYTVYGDYLYFMDFLFLNDEKFTEMMGQYRIIRIGNNTFEGTIVECNYDHELRSEQYVKFFDQTYESSSIGLKKFITQSKLYRVWKDKADAEMPGLRAKWEAHRETLAKDIARRTKDLGATVNAHIRDKELEEIKRLEAEVVRTREFKEPEYPQGPMDQDNIMFAIIEARFRDVGDGINITGGWVPLRFRDDKDFPNNFNTAKSMIETIFRSNITEEELIEKLCVAPQEEQGKQKKVKK